jgi:hypothetical protein
VQARLVSGIEGGDMAARRQQKVKFALKAAAFIATVLTLSWFFEGCREVRTGWTVSHIAVLTLGTLTTVFMLGVQGYWIYIEEKVKGTLKRRVGLFERIYAWSQKRNGGDSGEKS